MSFFKKHLLIISLMVALLSMGILCVYSIYTYQESTTNVQSKMQQGRAESSNSPQGKTNTATQTVRNQNGGSNSENQDSKG